MSDRESGPCVGVLAFHHTKFVEWSGAVWSNFDEIFGSEHFDSESMFTPARIRHSASVRFRSSMGANRAAAANCPRAPLCW